MRFEQIDDTMKSKREYGLCYGCESYLITEDDIEALRNGKCLASTINSDEYSIFVSMKEWSEDNE